MVVENSLTLQVFCVKVCNNISKPCNNVPNLNAQPRHSAPDPAGHPYRSVPCLLNQPFHLDPGPIHRTCQSTVNFTSQPLHSSVAPVNHKCRSTVNLLSQPLHSCVTPVSYKCHPTGDFIKHRQCHVVNHVPCPRSSFPCPVCHHHCGCLARHVYCSYQTWGSELACSVVQWAGCICGARTKVVNLKFINRGE